MDTHERLRRGQQPPKQHYSRVNHGELRLQRPRQHGLHAAPLRDGLGLCREAAPRHARHDGGVLQLRRQRHPHEEGGREERHRGDEAVKSVNGMLETERETLHVMDDQRRIAIVETLTVENGNRVAAPAPGQRYQLDNHLGSASLELDDSANIISYEEYYPYGDTSYRAGRNASEVSRKRYRYTGKEKDEESSLYYCEQRYYAAHISRWVSTPVSGVDPSGTGTDDVVWDVPDFVQTEEDFRNWVYDNAGAYIDGDVTVERTDDGRPIFNYNDADITVDQARRAEMETENRTFGSYLPGTAAGEDALGYYADLVVKGERQGGAWGSVEKGLGYTLGFFAALWTPETAIQTAFTLGTAGVGNVAAAGSMLHKGWAVWGTYESSISLGEGVAGVTSGLHTADLASWARSGQYQGGQGMSGLQRGLSIGFGVAGIGASFASVANYDPRLLGKAQSTGTRGHKQISRLIAFGYQLNPRVERITMNLGYKKLMGGGIFKNGPRPDVGVLYKSGRVKAIEVQSKTDKPIDLRSRNKDFMADFDIKVSVSINPCAVWINRIFPKRR